MQRIIRKLRSRLRHIYLGFKHGARFWYDKKYQKRIYHRYSERVRRKKYGCRYTNIRLKFRKKHIGKKRYAQCNECKYLFPPHLISVDHIIPVAQGGANEFYNLQLLCNDCHEKKTKQLR